MSDQTNAIRCPRCGARIERPCPPVGQTLPGSPLRKCPGCGRLYYDEAYAEPALTAFERAKIRFPYIKILYAALPTAGALIYLHSYLRGGNANALVPIIAFGVIALLFDVLLLLALGKAAGKARERKAVLALLESRGAPMDAETRASMERLGKKDYLDALTQCGEDIPKYFYQRIGEAPPKPGRRKS